MYTPANPIWLCKSGVVRGGLNYIGLLTWWRHISISFWYSDVLYTSQVLEIVSQKWQKQRVLFILLNLKSDKSSSNPHYHKLVPNPVISIISLSKNDRILVLTKVEFLIIFHILPWKSVTLKCTGGVDFWSRIFFKLGWHHMFYFYFVICVR